MSLNVIILAYMVIDHRTNWVWMLYSIRGLIRCTVVAIRECDNAGGHRTYKQRLWLRCWDRMGHRCTAARHKVYNSKAQGVQYWDMAVVCGSLNTSGVNVSIEYWWHEYRWNAYLHLTIFSVKILNVKHKWQVLSWDSSPLWDPL